MCGLLLANITPNDQGGMELGTGYWSIVVIVGTLLLIKGIMR